MSGAGNFRATWGGNGNEGKMTGNKITYQDYLEQYGVNSTLQKIMDMVLLYRPEDPVQFIAESLKEEVQNSSSVVRSMRLLYHCKRNDNLAREHLSNLYQYLDARKTGPAVSFDQVQALLLVAADAQRRPAAGAAAAPAELLLRALRESAAGDGELGVPFEKFCAAMKAMVLFEDVYGECCRVCRRALPSWNEEEASDENLRLQDLTAALETLQADNQPTWLHEILTPSVLRDQEGGEGLAGAKGLALLVFQILISS